ncbi:putative phosphatidylinositol 3,4,5-trisphosphate 3-phosphatase TPTE2P1 [Macaca thibetana thibetana]|uniref:putative phosphatidylinositol 3,4,5-trisphosphate 3-phosphatase TPTE2P1 n=1 Tax=Macaca thibetana thibetana TaxID=257877 RepID=UPI0021BCFA3C|nr:putative phosphatidylinositol 3,4,5-trisphosphate 3-phosphatase TPTE2P1 [Macaca thibetana thibetana]
MKLSAAPQVWQSLIFKSPRPLRLLPPASPGSPGLRVPAPHPRFAPRPRAPPRPPPRLCLRFLLSLLFCLRPDSAPETSHPAASDCQGPRTPRGEVSLCRPGWSAVARSQLSATSASQVQTILLPQTPE